MAVLCRSCSGKLIFNPATQKLECAQCGNSYRPEDVEDFNSKLDTRYYDTRVYTCPQCGAEVITSDTEVSTFCVYCGNPAIVFNRISKELRPDGIVPFKVTKEEAIKKIKNRFLKNPIVPKEIKSKCTPENLRGIYVPYWIINADYTEADFISGRVKKGKNSETEYFSRAGDVKFKNIPIDGSNSLNDDISRKLEPFYLEDSRSFDEDYLNGFYSSASDLSYKDLRNSAALRCHKLYEEEIVKTVKANDVKILDSIYWVDIHDDPVYMMMPVWFFTFKHEDKPYTVLVNGQSGKVIGTMPWQKKKIWAIAISIFLAAQLIAIALTWAVINGVMFLSQIFAWALVAIIVCSFYFSIRGSTGIKRILKNLELTQSEAIFKYAKRRQG